MELARPGPVSDRLVRAGGGCQEPGVQWQFQVVGTLGDAHGKIGDGSWRHCIPNLPVVFSQKADGWRLGKRYWNKKVKEPCFVNTIVWSKTQSFVEPCMGQEGRGGGQEGGGGEEGDVEVGQMDEVKLHGHVPWELGHHGSLHEGSRGLLTIFHS